MQIQIQPQNQSVNPKVSISYIAVIIIWSTTPLAIKWSAEGAGFLFALISRMLLGTLCAGAIMLVLKQQLPWNLAALKIYLAAAVSIYGSMLLVYWGALYIPSGLIAVLFGFAPMLTGLLASRYLQEQRPGKFQWLALLISFGGLVLIFYRGIVLQTIAVEGIIAVMLAVVLHSASAVAIKAMNVSLSALAITTGGLLVSTPLFLLSGFLGDASWPAELDSKTSLSIIYLGLMGSVIGFILYYYLIEKLLASTVALITLITPVTALLVGLQFNNEAFGLQLAAGILLVMAGLLMYQWKNLVGR